MGFTKRFMNCAVVAMFVSPVLMYLYMYIVFLSRIAFA